MMELLGKSSSDKLGNLITAVESVEARPIRIELVPLSALPPLSNAELLYRCGNEVVLRIPQEHWGSSSILSEDIEYRIAHELGHLWCRSNGFPLAQPIGSVDNQLHKLILGFAANIVEHYIVNSYLGRFGFDTTSQREIFELSFAESTCEDPPSNQPLPHLVISLKHAEYLLHYNLSTTTIQAMEHKLPNTFPTTVQIADIVSKRNPQSPDDQRRTTIAMLRFIEEKSHGVLEIRKLILIPLVLSSRQLDSPASQYLEVRPIVHNGRFLMQTVYNGEYICSNKRMSDKEELQQFFRKVAEDLKTMTMKQFLEAQQISYAEL